MTRRAPKHRSRKRTSRRRPPISKPRARGVVDANGRVHLTQVQLGLDNGTTVDVVNGLNGGEQIIATCPPNATDGLQVQVVQAASPG